MKRYQVTIQSTKFSTYEVVANSQAEASKLCMTGERSTEVETEEVEHKLDTVFEISSDFQK